MPGLKTHHVFNRRNSLISRGTAPRFAYADPAQKVKTDAKKFSYFLDLFAY